MTRILLNTKLWLAAALTSVFSFGLPVKAQGLLEQTDPCEQGGDCPSWLDGITDFSGAGSVYEIIIQIANFLVIIAAGLSVVFLVWGAILFITDGGSGDRAEKGKGLIKNAIIGLIIAALAYAIVSIVLNLVLGNLLGDVFGG